MPYKSFKYFNTSKDGALLGGIYGYFDLNSLDFNSALTGNITPVTKNTNPYGPITGFYAFGVETLNDESGNIVTYVLAEKPEIVINKPVVEVIPVNTMATYFTGAATGLFYDFQAGNLSGNLLAAYSGLLVSGNFDSYIFNAPFSGSNFNQGDFIYIYSSGSGSSGVLSPVTSSASNPVTTNLNSIKLTGKFSEFEWVVPYLNHNTAMSDPSIFTAFDSQEYIFEAIKIAKLDLPISFELSKISSEAISSPLSGQGTYFANPAKPFYFSAPSMERFYYGSDGRYYPWGSKGGSRINVFPGNSQNFRGINQYPVNAPITIIADISCPDHNQLGFGLIAPAYPYESYSSQSDMRILGPSYLLKTVGPFSTASGRSGLTIFESPSPLMETCKDELDGKRHCLSVATYVGNAPNNDWLKEGDYPGLGANNDYHVVHTGGKTFSGWYNGGAYLDPFKQGRLLHSYHPNVGDGRIGMAPHYLGNIKGTISGAIKFSARLMLESYRCCTAGPTGFSNPFNLVYPETQWPYPPTGQNVLVPDWNVGSNTRFGLEHGRIAGNDYQLNEFMTPDFTGTIFTGVKDLSSYFSLELWSPDRSRRVTIFSGTNIHELNSHPNIKVYSGTYHVVSCFPPMYYEDIYFDDFLIYGFEGCHLTGERFVKLDKWYGGAYGTPRTFLSSRIQSGEPWWLVLKGWGPAGGWLMTDRAIAPPLSQALVENTSPKGGYDGKFYTIHSGGNGVDRPAWFSSRSLCDITPTAIIGWANTPSPLWTGTTGKLPDDPNDYNQIMQWRESIFKEQSGWFFSKPWLKTCDGQIVRRKYDGIWRPGANGFSERWEVPDMEGVEASDSTSSQPFRMKISGVFINPPASGRKIYKITTNKFLGNSVFGQWTLVPWYDPKFAYSGICYTGGAVLNNWSISFDNYATSKEWLDKYMVLQRKEGAYTTYYADQAADILRFLGPGDFITIKEEPDASKKLYTIFYNGQAVSYGNVPAVSEFEATYNFKPTAKIQSNITGIINGPIYMTATINTNADMIATNIYIKSPNGNVVKVKKGVTQSESFYNNGFFHYAVGQTPHVGYNPNNTVYFNGMPLRDPRDPRDHLAGASYPKKDRMTAILPVNVRQGGRVDGNVEIFGKMVIAAAERWWDDALHENYITNPPSVHSYMSGTLKEYTMKYKCPCENYKSRVGAGSDLLGRKAKSVFFTPSKKEFSGFWKTKSFSAERKTLFDQYLARIPDHTGNYYVSTGEDFMQHVQIDLVSPSGKRVRIHDNYPLSYWTDTGIYQKAPNGFGWKHPGVIAFEQCGSDSNDIRFPSRQYFLDHLAEPCFRNCGGREENWHCLEVLIFSGYPVSGFHGEPLSGIWKLELTNSGVHHAYLKNYPNQANCGLFDEAPFNYFFPYRFLPQSLSPLNHCVPMDLSIRYSGYFGSPKITNMHSFNFGSVNSIKNFNVEVFDFIGNNKSGEWGIYLDDNYPGDAYLVDWNISFQKPIFDFTGPGASYTNTIDNILPL